MTITEQYENKQKEWKSKIREKTKHRWIHWLWYLIAFPFVWIFYNIRDWRTAIIFVIVFLVVSSEVWIPYLIGVIFWANEPLRISMFSVGSACWLFWLGPFTPFLPLCMFLTIGIKALFDKITKRRKNKNEKSK